MKSPVYAGLFRIVDNTVQVVRPDLAAEPDPAGLPGGDPDSHRVQTGASGIVLSTVLSLRSNLHQTFSLTQHGNDVLLRVRKDASFLAKPLLVRHLSAIDDGAHVLIDAERADFIDRDVIDALNAFIADAPRRDIIVETHHWPAILPAIGSLPAAAH